jgi:DNA-directed RNA polymerase subunit L
MDNVFAKPKIKFGEPNENGIVEVQIQDEWYTIMEPLKEILQSDQRLIFAGYKIQHCLENEIVLRLKCKPGAGFSEKVCFQDALTTFLSQLSKVEDTFSAAFSN